MRTAPSRSVALAALLVAAGCSSNTEGPIAPPVRPSALSPEAAARLDAPARYLRAATVAQLREVASRWNLGFEANGEPRYHVMVKLQHGAALESTYDVRVGAKFGTIVSVYATRAGLDALGAHPAVTRVEAMRRMSLTNDISTTRSSLIVRDPANPMNPLSIPLTGGNLVIPFTPASANEISFKMSKQGQTVDPTTGTQTTVSFRSTITVCGVQPTGGACPAGGALATATANGPGGDAVTAPTAFAANAPVYVILSGSGTAGANQPASVNVALTAILDSSQGFTLGSKARDSGNDGTGVIFADIDTGIDFCHPDFIDPATGQSRILYLWDQSLAPEGSESPPPEPEFAAAGGVEYTSADVNASLMSCSGGNPSPVRTRDLDAHGTHTAGTGAGNGGGTPYIGAAPKAGIIAVKGLGESFADVNGQLQLQHLAEALKYAVVRARALHMPVALNNSWGSFGGEADGLTLFEQAVSSVAGQGSVPVFAAGNSGGQPAHATSTIPPAAIGATDTWYLRQMACYPGMGTSTIAKCVPRYLNIWTDAKDAYTVTLTDAAGMVQSWSSCDLALPVGTTKTLGDPTTGGSVAVFASSAIGPGGQDLYFQIPAATSAITGRVFWTITMIREASSTGSGAWDAYVGDGENLAIIPYDTTTSPPPPDPPLALRHVTHFPNASNTTGFLESTYTPGQVGQPATGFGVVSVGATTGNIRFLDNSAAMGGYTEPTDAFLNFNALGNFTYFSARGPSRDGRALPHVAAPGMYVVSAASQFAAPPLPATTLIYNAAAPGVATGVQHALFSGTSMATPGVTGSAVLMLESDPTNFPRPLIRNTAAQDLLTQEMTAMTGVPTQGWSGAGKVDAVAALAALKEDQPPVASSLAVSDVTPTAGSALTMTATASDPDGTLDEYLWDIDGDGFIDFFTNKTQPTPNVLELTTPNANGTFTAKVIVVDNFGKTATATVMYTATGAFDAGAPDASSPLCLSQGDAGPITVRVDAGADSGSSVDGGQGSAKSRGGCGCRVVGNRDAAGVVASSTALAAAFLVGARLRRRRAR